MAPTKNDAPTEKISKQEAVRRALAELGNDTTPTVIQGLVKERFAIEMSKDHISVCKGKILRNRPAKGKKATKQKVAAQSPATSSAVPSKGVIAVEDVLIVKELTGRLGPDQLLTLIGALAK
jgi:hypothetical protein